MDNKNKDNFAIKKALKEAEEIFGRPVTFKVRDKDGNLVGATEEDIIKVESHKEIEEPQERFKFSVTTDADGSKATFSRKLGDKVVYEESHFSSPSLEEPRVRFEVLEEDNKNNSEEREKLKQEAEKKEKEAQDAKKRLEDYDKKVFTQHHQIPPKK